ncbi:hypothetical protein ACH47B_38650 [Rhodococcus sp. NPDC019627]|uniref:hypothetical protein n=1 Tax=unclassified Rhodococcus (in: high G+C Gram-positive bacteria) TaxID=192944 RepID=UPI0033E19DB4
MQDHHSAYLDGLQKLVPTPHEGTDQVAANVARRRDELEKLRSVMGQKAVLKTTKMIEEAAHEALGADLARDVVLEWRAGSGAAHGLAWQLFGTPGTTRASEADERGLASFQAGGSYDRIVNGYMAAFRLTECGWRSLRRRGR